MSRVIDPRRAAALRLGADLVCWFVGLVLALLIRFGFDPGWAELRSTLLFVPLLLALQVLIGEFAGVYRRRTFDTVDELTGLAGAVLVATAIAAAFNAVLEDQIVPHSVPLAGGALALLGMIVVRALRRMVSEQQVDAPPADIA